MALASTPLLCVGTEAGWLSSRLPTLLLLDSKKNKRCVISYSSFCTQPIRQCATSTTQSKARVVRPIAIRARTWNENQSQTANSVCLSRSYFLLASCTYFAVCKIFAVSHERTFHSLLTLRGTLDSLCPWASTFVKCKSVKQTKQCFDEFPFAQGCRTWIKSCLRRISNWKETELTKLVSIFSSEHYQCDLETQRKLNRPRKSFQYISVVVFSHMYTCTSDTLAWTRESSCQVLRE